ncbi:acyl carrier protein [Corynebacterium glutamicum]|uniref:acyl carrier protein n=1 Tax=Corynebacterium glutamicum TaxID=1718 RepID=UPI00097A6C2C|nr:acyl carrier protein [Corynebacterium glutamicum]GAV97766.1 acyl carrier protein [Corynebacterium glutamicum]HJE11474.1 acyl carrier protein [Corynebacterium glutamicum]
MDFNDKAASENAAKTGAEGPNVFASVAKILQDVGGISAEDVTPESRFTEDLAVSSLNYIELIVNAEDAFGVRIEDADAKDLTTVQDLIDFINTNKAD